jgi:hypothetical protein
VQIARLVICFSFLSLNEIFNFAKNTNIPSMSMTDRVAQHPHPKPQKGFMPLTFLPLDKFL